MDSWPEPVFLGRTVVPNWGIVSQIPLSDMNRFYFMEPAREKQGEHYSPLWNLSTGINQINLSLHVSLIQFYYTIHSKGFFSRKHVFFPQTAQ
jgi:hypothetical protein